MEISERAEATPCARCYEGNRDIRLALSAAGSFDQALRVLLIVLTQRPEFCFDRAAVFAERNNMLMGYVALGPNGPEEAEVFARERSDDLPRALNQVGKLSARFSDFERQVRTICFPETDGDHPALRSLRTGVPIYLPEGLCELALTEKCSPGFLFPIFARGRACAVAYADCAYTGEAPNEAAMWRAAALGNMIDDYGELASAHVPVISEPVGILAERMLTVTRLAMRLAHLARNPLAVVGGFSHHLRTKIGEAEPARRALDAILQSTERLEDLIDEIPAYALSPDTEPEELDLRAVVEDGAAALPQSRGWQLDLPAERCPVVTYAGILAACVYLVGRYAGSEGTIEIKDVDGAYEIWFGAKVATQTEGIEMMCVDQLIRMTGGSCRWESEASGRRFLLRIPRFVHCPVTIPEKAGRF